MSHERLSPQWVPEISMPEWMKRLIPYRGQYVAVLPDRIISHTSFKKVLQEARASGEPFTIYAVPKNWGKLRIFPIRIRSLGFHYWIPFYPVSWRGKDGNWIKTQALVDSGADISVIPFEMGLELGFTSSAQELPQQAVGLSGTLNILLRQVEVKIDDVTATIPVAWAQESEFTEIILG